MMTATTMAPATSRIPSRIVAIFMATPRPAAMLRGTIAAPPRPRPAQGKALIALDEIRRAAILKSEQAQARRNAASKEIGQAKAKKDEAAAQTLMAEVAELKDKIPEMERAAKEAEEKLNAVLANIPNM